MREENWLSMALIVLGGFLLLHNLGVIPSSDGELSGLWP